MPDFRSRLVLLAACSLLPLAAPFTAAAAPPVSQRASAVLPTAGKVVAGSASLSTAGGTLVVDQTSRDAIIDWKSFSIGPGAAVRFDNGQGATLNEVSGGDLSAIEGQLSGTGSVYLINSAGIIVGKDGVVRTGGTFVASTLNLSGRGFSNGSDLVFAGTSGASVVNLGKVGSLGGDVQLIAATVRNDGAITAARGDAGLLAGYRVLVRDKALNNGKFAVLLGGQATGVTNAGLISAADAELRANGGNIYALAGNTRGIIAATRYKSFGGHVWLVAEGGTLDVAGAISAKGAGGVAGAIETSGQTVNLGSAAIDAHGGQWSVDPVNLEITVDGAQTISNALATSNVVERTGAAGAIDQSGQGVKTPGEGDIILDPGANIAWTSSHTLGLVAYDNLTLGGSISMASGRLNLHSGSATAVNAPITVSGAGTVYISAATDSTSFQGKPFTELTFANGADLNYGPVNNGGRLAIQGHGYHLLYALSLPGGTGPDNGTDDIAGIRGIGSVIEGYDALATNLVQPTGQVFHKALVENIFGGTFEGLGNTITGLTITDSSQRSVVGLFSAVSGTVRDLNMIGGMITTVGGSYVGGIAGYSGGEFLNDSSSVAINAGSENYAGGLVGVNAGGIVANSYATGSVSAGAGAWVGGLIGQLGSGGVYRSYASGSVTGGAMAYVGGLVGQSINQSTINQAYATGAVSGGSGAILDGLAVITNAGTVSGGTITAGYYDADTTGQPLGTQSSGSVGLTTAQLQSGLPSGFSATAWGVPTAGGYPYLLSFGPPP